MSFTVPSLGRSVTGTLSETNQTMRYMPVVHIYQGSSSDENERKCAIYPFLRSKISPSRQKQPSIQSAMKTSNEAGSSRRHPPAPIIVRRESTPGLENIDPFCCINPLNDVERQCQQKDDPPWSDLRPFVQEARAKRLALPSKLAEPETPGDFRTPQCTIIQVDVVTEHKFGGHDTECFPFVHIYDDFYCLWQSGDGEDMGWQFDRQIRQPNVYGRCKEHGKWYNFQVRKYVPPEEEKGKRTYLQPKGKRKGFAQPEDIPGRKTKRQK